MKSNQMYLKLDDHSIRPTYDTNGINKNSSYYIRFKSNFLKWLDELNPSETENKKLDDIIYDLLKKSIYDNGYKLANYLEDKYFITEIDCDLVNLLDTCDLVRYQLQDEKVNQWVNECHLFLSDNLLDKYVSYEYIKSFGKTETEYGYIVNLHHDSYQVTVGKEKTSTGGYIIDFEKIKIIEE